jgi:hypothetical protein
LTVGIALAAILAGCEGLLGVDGLQFVGPDAAQSDAGAADADASLQDAAPSSDARPADATLSDGSTTDSGPPCASRTVDVNTGVFVAASGGVDQPSCGSIAAPCATIQTGITQAHSSGASTVYVATGTYTESITVTSGLTLEGAWSATPTGWTPVCGIAAVTAVSIELPSGHDTVVTVSPGATGVTLRYLGILADAPPAAASQSLYGVFAQSAQLALEDVAVTMGSGGSGDAGAPGSPVPTAVSGCLEGDAATGNAASNTPPPTPSGTFGASGYETSSGVTGASDGGTGGTGTCTAPGYTNCSTCAPGCPAGAQVSGCGGAPGLGGMGGQGGGSSIAVYGWNSRITLVGGTFVAGNGGNGGNGGDGGPGGPGGSYEVLPVTYYPGCVCIGNTLGNLIGGTGGAGGPGGRGAGGAGGFSYAVFSGGDAGTLTLASSPKLVHGEAGAGGTFNGPPGRAADQGP